MALRRDYLSEPFKPKGKKDIPKIFSILFEEPNGTYNCIDYISGDSEDFKNAENIIKFFGGIVKSRKMESCEANKRCLEENTKNILEKLSCFNLNDNFKISGYTLLKNNNDEYFIKYFEDEESMRIFFRELNQKEFEIVERCLSKSALIEYLETYKIDFNDKEEVDE